MDNNANKRNTIWVIIKLAPYIYNNDEQNKHHRVAIHHTPPFAVLEVFQHT